MMPAATAPDNTHRNPSRQVEPLGWGRVASLGVAPSLEQAGQIDRRARLLLAGLGPLVSWIDRRYRFDALTSYKEKFRPTSWRPRYVAVLPPRPSVRLVGAIRAVLG